MFIGRRELAVGGHGELNEAMDAALQPEIVALVRDLMFSSRIRATAKDLGVAVRLVREPQQVIAAGGRRLLVDLNQEGAIEAAREWKQATGGVVVGFVSHVDVETVTRARAAGVDQVMARSRFVERLSALISVQQEAEHESTQIDTTLHE
jgi:hypothetical protein